MADDNDFADKSYQMVVLTFKKLLQDDTYSDLQLLIGKETVMAHAAIVSCRCQEIIGFPQDDKKKKTSKLQVKITQVNSASIMQNVLEFLYTGQVDFPKLPEKDILLLTGASRQFKLGRLTYLCEKWLREHLTIESVFHLLKAATDLDDQRVKGICLQFALQHYNEFISNKDGIYILGIELFQEVVAAFQTNPQPPKELRAEDNPDTLLADFQKMHDVLPYSDITFSIGGENIKAHRAVLAAHSDGFNSLFKDDSALRLSPRAFKSMLKFLYYGHDDVEALPACELVGFSRNMKLSSLQRVCEEKIRHSVEIKTVLPILSVAYLPSDKPELASELKGKCFPFILQNLSSIDLTLIKTFNPMMIVDLLLELQNSWKKGEYGLGGPLNLGAISLDKPQHHPEPEASRNLPPPSLAGSEPMPVKREQSNSGLTVGAQRNRPPPPPRNGRGPNAPVTTPPPPLSQAPPPPLSSQPPPPLSQAPPPPTVATPTTPHEDHPEEAKGPLSKKDKKEEERRKKEEAKRLQKEKKERAKMEKKFKGGS